MIIDNRSLVKLIGSVPDLGVVALVFKFLANQQFEPLTIKSF